MKPTIHDAAARQSSGGPAPVRGRSGNRDDRARKPGPGRGRTRNRRVARLVDRRAAACLAPTASRGTAGGSQPRPAHPSHGGASATLRRRLQSLAEAPDKGALAVKRGIVLKAGTTTLVRQWRGHTHTVLVQKDGFEHEGQRYRSLTVIAERITGAHWSGPRFFGLTKQARASLPAETSFQ